MGVTREDGIEREANDFVGGEEEQTSGGLPHGRRKGGVGIKSHG